MCPPFPGKRRRAQPSIAAAGSLQGRRFADHAALRVVEEAQVMRSAAQMYQTLSAHRAVRRGGRSVLRHQLLRPQAVLVVPVENGTYKNVNK